MLMPFWEVILFSVRLAVIYFSLLNLRLLQHSRFDPRSKSPGGILKLLAAATHFDSVKCTLIPEMAISVQPGLTALGAAPLPSLRLINGFPSAMNLAERIIVPIAK